MSWVCRSGAAVSVPRRGVASGPTGPSSRACPGSRHSYPTWQVAFLRDASGSAGRSSLDRRLYIPRNGHRTDRQRRRAAADPRGARLRDYSTRAGGEDPRHAFAEAEVVVGGHGAGLSDLAFCRPGTRVLELSARSRIGRPTSWTVSSSAGLRYGYADRRRGTRLDPDHVATDATTRIDPDEFRRRSRRPSARSCATTGRQRYPGQTGRRLAAPQAPGGARRARCSGRPAGSDLVHRRLLQHVRGPAGVAGEREGGREQVGRQARPPGAPPRCSTRRWS